MSNHHPFISPVPEALVATELAIQRIRSVIEGSPVPEDLIHSSNTLEWILRLAPLAGEALRIAALGHDIDRAVGSRRVRKADFQDFEEFKAAHAKNSALIVKEILDECRVDKSLTEEVLRLVRLHETGGDERSDLLMVADSLSFFEVNLPHYWVRHSRDVTFQRGIWGYKRLTPESRETVKKFRYADERLNTLVREIAMAVEE